MSRFLLLLLLLASPCLAMLHGRSLTTQTLASLENRYPQLPDIPANGDEECPVSPEWVQSLRTIWLAEDDPAHKEELRETLIDIAAWNGYSRLLNEALTGASLEATHLPDTADTHTVNLTAVAFLPELEKEQYQMLNIRKVGTRHFECWTTSTGYLLDLNGRVVKRAEIKRVDGRGREWGGAFLADGSYCTTDIWEQDRQLHVFTSKDRWIKSVKLPCTVAWARADKSGKAWIARAYNSDCSSEFFRVTAAGKSERIISDLHDHLNWRELGSIHTSFLFSVVPSDNQKFTLMRQGVNHGPHSMYSYLRGTSEHIAGMPSDEWEQKANFHRTLSDNRDMGFFPASNAWWADGCLDEDTYYPITWLFQWKDKLSGWVEGTPLADAADNKGLYIVAPGGVVRDVTPAGKVRSITRFQLDGETVQPRWLPAKTNLGVFSTSKGLCVGVWKLN